MENRRFPILHGGGATIPWSLAEEAWKTYAKNGHGDQSCERIAQRGGFGIQEIACCLAGHYNRCPDERNKGQACMSKLVMRLADQAQSSR